MDRRYFFLFCLWLAIGAPVATTHALTWGTFGTWDTQTRRDAANASMQAVLDRFNVYGDFNWGSDGYVDVYYNSGVPTAQAGLYGAIEFGGTWPNERVTQHELNHWLGSGTEGNWYNLFTDGVWTGAKVNALIKQFDGEDAVLRQSGYHFYGYGLNYDSEVTDNSIYMRNVALTYAMRQDMGTGNPNDPWSATSATLTGSDPAGTSAFNWFGGGYSGSYPGWDDNYFAHAGADYSTGAYDMRTPQGYSSWTFAGDSLTVGSGGRLLFNGWGTTGTVTIQNLNLSGTLRHDQYSQDLFRLAGSMKLTRSAVIDAGQGEIEIVSSISGSGSFRKIGSYSLTLKSTANNYAGATTVALGELIVDGATGYGTTSVANGASLSGAGNVRGTLLAQSGSTIRVGGTGLVVGLPDDGHRIDNFESYTSGAIGATPNTTGGVWTGVQDGTANAVIVDNSGDNALRVYGVNSGSNSWRGAVTNLQSSQADDFSLADGETGTYFFRVRRNGTGNIDTVFGLTDQSTVSDTDTPWDEYAVLLSIAGTEGRNSSNLRAYSDGAGDINLMSLTNTAWVNVWLEVDNDNKTYRVATSTGDADGVYRGGDYQFGRRTASTVGTNPLVTFGIHEQYGVGVELDDLYFVPGANLTNPLTLVESLIGETLTVGGDFELYSNATLEVDLGEGVSDLLAVAGQATLDGVLAITLDDNYTPSLNDTFTVLTASAITNQLTLGGADGSLFSLAASTATELVLTVVSGLAGDYNNDGLVDQADYTVWRNHLGQGAATLLNDNTNTRWGRPST